MNTAIFNILLVLFCLLYILHFSFWFRLKKFAPFKNSPQSRLYTFLAPAIVAVCVIVIGVLFIMDSQKEPHRFQVLHLDMPTIPLTAESQEMGRDVLQ